jgi:hypothetical protein
MEGVEEEEGEVGQEEDMRGGERIRRRSLH